MLDSRVRTDILIAVRVFLIFGALFSPILLVNQVICHCYGDIFSYIYQALKQPVSCGQYCLFCSKEFGVESGMLVFGNLMVLLESLVKYMVQMVLEKLVVYNMIGVRVEATKEAGGCGDGRRSMRGEREKVAVAGKSELSQQVEIGYEAGR